MEIQGQKYWEKELGVAPVKSECVTPFLPMRFGR